MKKILITGGEGFIGHHFVQHIIKNTDWEIAIIDKLTYASNGHNRLRDIEVFNNKRVSIFNADFSYELSDGLVKEIGKVNHIIHLGAETHVANSIKNPRPFVRSNILGTMEMLEYAKKYQKDLESFVYFSTDEVFGSAPKGKFFKEWDRYNSGNPYSATKAGGEELCLAYANTYDLPILITHTMNVFGERQHPEKFIPKVVRACLLEQRIKIHCNEDKSEIGSRYWIHARNVSSSVLNLIENEPSKKGWKKGDKYNIVGEREINNLEMAKIIASVLGKKLKYDMIAPPPSRPGNDMRYALDGKKMISLGWRNPIELDYSLKKTIKWVGNPKNEKWLYWDI
jgi:dTDP-glucose 4,6-dehydratase